MSRRVMQQSTKQVSTQPHMLLHTFEWQNECTLLLPKHNHLILYMYIIMILLILVTVVESRGRISPYFELPGSMKHLLFIISYISHTELWDSLLEIRINLQKALSLSNQLPQCNALPDFKKAEIQPLQDALTASQFYCNAVCSSYLTGIVVDQCSLQGLLNKLLELQKSILLKNSETKLVLSGEHKKQSCDGDSDSDGEDDGEDEDEEIPSEDEDDAVKHYNQEDEEQLSDSVTDSYQMKRRKRRKRKLESWPLAEEEQESYINDVHTRLQAYQYNVIDRWNKKLRLATGKTTSKVNNASQFSMSHTLPLHFALLHFIGIYSSG